LSIYIRRLCCVRRPLALGLALLAGLLGGGPARAEEGMWTMDALPFDAIARDVGFRPDAEWVRHTQRASVRLAGGCSGSFVSPEGLVLTNHHCGVRCVEDLSNAAHDFVRDGFYARSREEEIKCPDVELNRLEEIRDVTGEVLTATGNLEGEAVVKARRAIEARLTSDCAGKDAARVRCDLVELYHGGRFHLYRYRRFQDVRLVFAPELAIAFFGGDPDNFNFPRYDLDCAILRAYEDGKPARIDDYFPIQAAGASNGEAVFVTGHPGRTDRLLTRAEYDTLRTVDTIPTLLRLSELRGFITRYGQGSSEAARISYTDLFGIENTRKALIGRLETLQDAGFLQTKAQAERELRDWVGTRSDLAADTPQAWDRIAAAEGRYREIANSWKQLERGQGFSGSYFGFARTLVRGAAERPLPNAERLSEFSNAALPRVEQLLFSNAPVYADFEQAKLAWSLTKFREILGADDPLVHQILGRESPEQLASRVVAGTRLGDPAERRRLWSGGQAAIDASTDPMILLARAIDPAARAVRKSYEEEVESVVRRNTALISRARFAHEGTGVYPDATFTLRLSYGRVAGWPENGKLIAPFTTFGGAFDRHTGAAPFALPESWLLARASLPMEQPLNFATTNDIIGGNSGSPVINRQRELVGLIFDGNIHSLGGDFVYEPKLNRAVAVSSGAILLALVRIYHAPELAQELRAAAR
jgi:hypothetical protein